MGHVIHSLPKDSERGEKKLKLNVRESKNREEQKDNTSLSELTTCYTARTACPFQAKVRRSSLNLHSNLHQTLFGKQLSQSARLLLSTGDISLHPSSSFLSQSQFLPFSSTSDSPSLISQTNSHFLSSEMRTAEAGRQDCGWGKMYHRTRLFHISLYPSAWQGILIPFLSAEQKEGEQLSLRMRYPYLEALTSGHL